MLSKENRPFEYTQEELENILEYSDIKRCREAFDLFDKNGNGKIEEKELIRMLTGLFILFPGFVNLL
jgi:Ca2+-binding EF-hand superfamily protein